MNKYIPTEVKDLTKSKQRVMRNVVYEIEKNSRRPKHKWRYVLLTAILTMSAMLFVLNEVFMENEQESATEQHLNLTKPTFSGEQGLLYLHGVTLGDSQSKVLDVFGENYTIKQEDASGADFIMDYRGTARLYFYEDKLDSIVLMNVDENYFDQLFNDYDGFKFFSTPYLYDDRFIYSKETTQVLKGSMEDTDGNLQLTLYYPSSDFQENAEYLYITEQNINIEQQSQSERYIDLTRPIFSYKKESFYLHGVTLGDSPSKVIEHLGGNYIIGQVDGSGADFIMDYDGTARFYFYEDKLDTILMKVDKVYFDQLYNDYDGFKFISSSSEEDNNRIFYSKESGQVLKGTTQVPNKDLYLSLSYATPDLWENPEMQDLD